MAAPTIKLTYFGIEGAAEKVRLALHIGKMAFEDERIDRDAWADLKPKTKFGQLPLMTIDVYRNETRDVWTPSRHASGGKTKNPGRFACQACCGNAPNNARLYGCNACQKWHRLVCWG